MTLLYDLSSKIKLLQRNGFIVYINLVQLLIIGDGFGTMLQNTTNHLLNTGYNLQPGIGYVSDTGRLASSVCFNVNRTIESGVDGRITFDMDKSFNEIEKSLGFSIDVGIGYGAFSSSTKASYLREIKVIVYRLIIFKNLKILNIFNSIIPAL